MPGHGSNPSPEGKNSLQIDQNLLVGFCQEVYTYIYIFHPKLMTGINYQQTDGAVGH
jgi:hypothetical protein